MAVAETLLFSVSKVFIYKVPPPKSVGQYRAEDWLQSPHVWAGQLKVVTHGDECTIQFKHTDKEGFYLTAPYTGPQMLETAIDSSRFFALRVSDGKGRNALLGLGFEDRKFSFDFKEALQSFENRKNLSAKADDFFGGIPLENLSIEPGQKIRIELPMGKKEKHASAAAAGFDADVKSTKKTGKKKADDADVPSDWVAF